MFALDKDIRKERAQLNMPEEEDETPYWEIPPWLVRPLRHAAVSQPAPLQFESIGQSLCACMHAIPLWLVRLRVLQCLGCGADPVCRTKQD